MKQTTETAVVTDNERVAECACDHDSQKAQRNMIIGASAAVILFITGIVLGYVFANAQNNSHVQRDDRSGYIMQQFEQRRGGGGTQPTAN
jgi:hypothetical protein